MSGSPAPDVDRVLRRFGGQAFSYRSFPRALEEFAPPPEPLPPEIPVVEPLPELTRDAGDRSPVSSAPAAPPPPLTPAIPASSIASAPPPLVSLRPAALPILTVARAALPARPPFVDTVTPLAAVFRTLASPARPRASHGMDVRDPPFPFRRG
ncbi:MAG: hypothetical protein JOZ42_07560 [Acetobacteraceae bacterium]|nr:hypothetical protein [Acetobacteraceae bacterium]